MSKFELFNDLSEESLRLIKQFIEFNPIGSIILNNKLEIVLTNKQTNLYFDGNIDLAGNFFGNIFHCQVVSNNEAYCGTKHQCSNCKIRNSLVNALNYNRVIRNVQVNKSFVIDGVKKTKWFDMTIVPIEVRSESYLWVSLIDLTELMKYKIEFEMNAILSDEENAIDKDQFHEEVMNCIYTHCYTGGDAYLVLIDLKHTQLIQESFGSLWRNDYLSVFHHFLKDKLDAMDYVCRYSQNQFMVFLPCKEKINFEDFISKLKGYQYSHFNTNDSVAIRTIHLKMNAEHISEVVKKGELYIEYFKAISLLEQIEEEDVFELEL